ncbi:MAG: IS1 family transposase, partial [Okeania sp. SIO2H7]|nr:IS1 family transposase [Okeania sp. SIO2H7]
MKCPKCGSDRKESRGKSRHGKQRYRCKNCGKWYQKNTAVNFSNTLKRQDNNPNTLREQNKKPGCDRSNLPPNYTEVTPELPPNY